MDVNVVLGEAKPCSDLARRLAMVYDLLLRRAGGAETENRIIEEQESLAATPVEASNESDFNNQIAAPHGPQALKS